MNLFVKIFLWFLAAIALMVGVVIFLTWTTQAEPVVQRWHVSVVNQTNIFAATAKQILENEGDKGLESFLHTIQQADTIDQAGIVDQNADSPLLETGNREILRDLVVKSLNSEIVEVDFNQPEGIFAARSFNITGGEKRVMFVKWNRSAPTPFFGEARYRYMRLLGLIVTAIIVCYVFALYLSSPIVKLSEAAKRLAAGDLETRVATDIGNRSDEIAKLARDFDEMAERIEALINSQKRLTRDVSHELRSPLARLNVALELAKHKSNAESQVLLDRIEREAHQLNEMISQILHLSRLESQSETIERRPINVGKMVEKIVSDANFEAKSEDKKVLIRENVEAEFHGNANLLRSAVENVLRNGLRYTSETVEVFVARAKAEIIIKIRDYGKGVPEEELEYLFKPFYRVSQARERKSGGVGLGLAIAEQAVQSHKGRITAQNAQDGGLIVEIRLPDSDAHPRTI